jgi:hypothetical protein
MAGCSGTVARAWGERESEVSTVRYERGLSPLGLSHLDLGHIILSEIILGHTSLNPEILQEKALLTSLIYYRTLTFILHLQNRIFGAPQVSNPVIFFPSAVLEDGFRMTLAQLSI